MRRLLALLMLMLAQPVLAAEHNADPTFANTSYFTLATGWTHPSGKLTGSNVRAQRAFRADTSLHAGDVIKYTVTVANWTAGSLQIGTGPAIATATGVSVPAPSIAGATPIADNFVTASGLSSYSSIAADSSADPNSAFRFIVAGPVKIGAFDPMVAPGLPGASHLHQFWCNSGVNPSSTFKSLRTSGDSNCGKKGFPVNRSAYWTPVMLDGQGNIKLPFFTNFYYKGVNSSNPACGSPDATHIGICIKIPNGLRYVAGYNMTTMSGGGSTGEPMWFECIDATNPAGVANSTRITLGGADRWPTLKAMYDAGCRTTSAGRVTIKQTIEAPTCWNGTELDSANHRSHMHYQDGPNVTMGYTSLGVAQPTKPIPSCPSTHPYLIPSFSIQQDWFADKAWDLQLWRLSSDEQMGMTVDAGVTAHMDYWAAWSDTVLNTWHTYCTEAHRTCSEGDLGDNTHIPTTTVDYNPAKSYSVSLTKYGYSRLLSGNGTFTGEITVADGGGFFLISPDGFSGDVTAFSITDVVKASTHASTTMHGGVTVTPSTPAVTWDTAFNTSNWTLSGSNLTATRNTGGSGGDQTLRASASRTRGYFEIAVTAIPSGGLSVGIATSAHPAANFVGGTSTSIGLYSGDGNLYRNGSPVTGTFGTFTAGDVMCLDLEGGKFYIGKVSGGVCNWMNGANPATGTNGIDVSASITNAIPAISTNVLSATQVTGRFAAGSFTGAVPSGSIAFQ